MFKSLVSASQTADRLLGGGARGEYHKVMKVSV